MTFVMVNNYGLYLTAREGRYGDPVFADDRQEAVMFRASYDGGPDVLKFDPPLPFAARGCALTPRPVSLHLRPERTTEEAATDG